MNLLKKFVYMNETTGILAPIALGGLVTVGFFLALIIIMQAGK